MSKAEQDRTKRQLPEGVKDDIQKTCNALSRALRFMTKVIDDDTKHFEEYYREHEDIKYRPKNGPNGEESSEPTEIDLVMQADKLSLPVKRLIDTIATIQKNLVSLDEPDTEKPSDDADEAENYAERARRLSREAKAAKALKNEEEE